MDDPIVLDAGNGFSVRALVAGSGLTLGDLPVVRFTGSVGNRQVTIVVPKSAHTSAATYVLEDAVAPAPIPPECPA